MNDAGSAAEVRRATAAHWDSRAATFDEAPDHGLIDPVVRAAWTRHLASWLPPSPARVADLGCGTGTLAVLVAGMGYEVTAQDLSPAMVARALRKAESAGVTVEVVVGDAAAPDLPDRFVDAVLVRHLVWSLPDPVGAIDRWVTLLRPGGRLVMVEGRWHLSVRDHDGAPGCSYEPTVQRRPPLVRRRGCGHVDPDPGAAFRPRCSP
jgi:ubiquinone/menaquinone biosynthesis C-methylase UbiE